MRINLPPRALEALRFMHASGVAGRIVVQSEHPAPRYYRLVPAPARDACGCVLPTVVDGGARAFAVAHCPACRGTGVADARPAHSSARPAVPPRPALQLVRSESHDATVAAGADAREADPR
jgi:hypothetical protein